MNKEQEAIEIVNQVARIWTREDLRKALERAREFVYGDNVEES